MVMLTRWNPTSDMMSHRMGRLFDEMLGNGFRRTAEERSLRGAWVPAINILERDEAVVITADLPGLASEDVEVTVCDRIKRPWIHRQSLVSAHGWLRKNRRAGMLTNLFRN